MLDRVKIGAALGAAVVAAAAGCTLPAQTVIATQQTPRLVCERQEAVGEDAILYLNLHEDERTGVEAARQAGVAGRVCRLAHGGGRNVTFGMGGRDWRFDPNRMFTRRGAIQTLANLNGLDTLAVEKEHAAALDSVRAVAAYVLAASGLARARAVVALHNNTDDQYSAQSYTAGGIYARDAAAVHLAPGEDADDFFFVTARALYEKLAAAGYNVVLQHPETVTDDGSLSVYCARQGIGYVNVEAEHGHAEKQRDMLRVLAEVISSADGP